jgi:tetratricopeptide (TPR) repeat protein
VEACELCQEILQLGEDYRILGTIAIVEVTLGLVEDAMTHYRKVLELCPEDDLTRKATTLHAIANFKAQQGDIEGALALYNQSLEIYKSINDLKMKAATLLEIGRLKAH